MRADRLLNILMTIQLRGRVTADRLAGDLEVSVRTIYRDVEALSRAGVPIVTESGRNGGLSLIKGFKTELTGLSEPEAQALPFAGLDAAAAALGLEASAEAARLKVLTALAPGSREQAHRVRECFYLDPADWYHHAVVPPHLRAVAAAAWAQQVIRMDYESWSNRKWRTVEPLGLVLKAGRWYLVASGADRRHPGIFKLEAIHGVEVQPQVFKRPKAFDLASTWNELMERFEASLRREQARIRVSPDALSRLERLGSTTAGTVRMAPAGRQGWREATIWIEGVDHAASLLLGFGVDIEVLAPAELRTEIARRARNVCSLYGCRGIKTSAGKRTQQHGKSHARSRA